MIPTSVCSWYEKSTLYLDLAVWELIFVRSILLPLETIPQQPNEGVWQSSYLLLWVSITSATYGLFICLDGRLITVPSKSSIERIGFYISIFIKIIIKVYFEN